MCALGIQYMVLKVGVVPLGKDIYDFSGRDKLGKIGEAVCQEYLKACSWVENVKSVRSDKEYQNKDIDIVVTSKDGKVCNIEVKTDSYISGNMFYETISNNITNQQGCFETSESDYIFYYFIHPEYRKIYVFKTKELREWVHKNKNRYKLKQVFNYTFCSLGYAIPLVDLMADMSQSIQILDMNKLENIEFFEEEARKFWDRLC